MVWEDGLTPAVARSAIERLKMEGLVEKPSWDHVFASSVQKPRTDGFQKRDVYEVLVEKIYPGVAVVWINEKWRARLTPQDFEGPVSLMKKDSKFKARGTLYREEGKLCLRVREVMEILS